MNNIIVFGVFVLLLISLFFYTYSKAKKITLGIIVVGIYLIVALNCLRCLFNDNFEFVPQLIFYPYLVFFIVLALLVHPLCKQNNYVMRLTPLNEGTANLIALGYIVATFLYIILNLKAAITLYVSGDFMSQYIEMRGEDAVFYNSFIERILVNIVNYFKIPMVLYAFYVYANDISFRWKKLLMLMPFLSSSVYAIMFSSRTDLVIIILIYAVAYMFYKEYLQLNIKKMIKRIALIAFYVICMLLFAISISRFGENDFSWLNEYFGHSFVTAHNLIAFTTSYGHGSIFFGFFMDLFGFPKTAVKCLIDNGVSFTTLIGIRYADFGFLGTMIYAIIVSYLFSSIVRKRTLDFGDLIIIVYYFISLFIGVFYDASNGVSWLMIFIISLVYKLLCKPNKKVRKWR